MKANTTQNKKRLRKQLDISRDLARHLGREAVEIQYAGFYVNKSGATVQIKNMVEAAVKSTVTYPPGSDLVLHSKQDGASPDVQVWNTTTLNALWEMQKRDLNPAILNMASATSPGGGFLNGVRAQEEYLARNSSLLICLSGNEMYTTCRTQKNPFYEDYIIYSADIPVFRYDDGKLLDQPKRCSVLTSPAVQANGVARYMPDRIDEIPVVMKTRILKLLAVAQKHNHRDLVLGAWGCGAFGNDSEQIAGLFRDALFEDFKGAFDNIVFAITDWSDDERSVGPFVRVFVDDAANVSN